MKTNETGIKKTTATWIITTKLTVDCPHCGSYEDIYEQGLYDLWEDVNEEFSEDDCKEFEFTCSYCGKNFGLNSINTQ